MDYEKKYKDALNWMRDIYPTLKGTDKEDAEHHFPELAESEDERIRKELLIDIPKVFPYEKANRYIAYLEKQKEQKPNYCHHDVDETGWSEEYRKAYYDGWNNCNQQHAQLEADRKPAEWSEEDETAFGDLMWCIEQARKSAKDENDMGNVWFAENWVKNRLKSLRPQPKQDVLPSLSEKEIICLKRALDYLRKEHGRYGGEDFTNEIVVLEWLITHPILVYSSQPHWKPSEEQKGALDYAYCELFKRKDVGHNILGPLSQLCDDLKKQL